MSEKEILIRYMLSFVGTPYHWGGDDAVQGYDCSGLVQEWLMAVGVWPKGKDATAQGLFHHFNPISRRDFRGLGTLSFYGRGMDNIGHVALGISPRLVLEAAGGDSRTVTLEAAIRQNAFVRVRPYDHRPDLLATLTPIYKIQEN